STTKHCTDTLINAITLIQGIIKWLISDFERTTLLHSNERDPDKCFNIESFRMDCLRIVDGVHIALKGASVRSKVVE
ncbi:hypothetical protein M8C21_002269, partial [Ambrosia artemisiifolia]